MYTLNPLSGPKGLTKETSSIPVYYIFFTLMFIPRKEGKGF